VWEQSELCKRCRAGFSPLPITELCDEARRIAPNIAKLESLDICHAVNAMPWPELIKRGAALHGSFFLLAN
jgi:hypothetical protein